jgi:DNA-binding response OmpR family regulator
MRILLVEDEIALARALARGLRRNAIAVDLVHDGETALHLARTRDYDVVVLDRDLPLLHGDEVCRQLQATALAPKILMLTASNALGDRVTGLNLGADDYVGKPVALMELLARVRALARRQGPLQPQTLEWKDLRVDPERRQAWRGERELDLTLREFMLLEELLTAQGAPRSTDQLIARVLDGARGHPTASTARVLVLRLRRKLGPPDAIATTPGRGYRLV